ncbi:MAG: hypothetical protein HYX27_16230 [Acidobacteria bacterium]|nr:hypothetical protein [Acidobacteriota bacterium]
MPGRLCLLVALAAHAQQLPLGRIVEEVVCATDQSQRYALYLPSTYTQDRAWPVILAFDPGGRGRRPVEQYQAAAEKFGYIVAGSNVSRNGSWQVSMNAAQAMGGDVTGRFHIDEKRIYTAGMSGGARVAMGIALGANSVVAGVIASSAGYPDSSPRKTLPFVLFSTAGNEDFNWLEMRSLDHALTSPHRLAVFQGGHVWLPRDLAIDAVEWLDIQAMKSDRIPRDNARLEQIFAARKAKAESTADPYQRCEALGALAADFKGLRDVPRDACHQEKAVKEARKKEQAEEDRERRMIGGILALEQQLNTAGQRSEAFARLTDQWKRMAASTNAGTDSADRRIARRVSRGLAMGAADRIKDAEYRKVIAAYGPARTGPR